ncbi:helix-turn-helix domain-containing protein [Streptococcus anginosus]|uniref:helix-turn-helix domain-containing protein n=1 Tax=Streptococcus anginosus TaxID=1328 RepID=UPI0023A9AB94|nr:helix-turn-helix transcriptional regulator [Streptococcus anginosus]WEB74446.1 helix-turn-helix transcriptional regulator [Streptococcus anginosus]
MFPTYEKIKELADKHGISLMKLEEDLGYSRNTLYKLKSQKPNAERISEIADYFHASTDYLLGRTDNPKVASNSAQSEVDLKKLAKESFFYDGHHLNDEDIDLISSLLETRIKNRQD